MQTYCRITIYGKLSFKWCIPNYRWLVGYQPREARRVVGVPPATFLITVATIWDAPF